MGWINASAREHWQAGQWWKLFGNSQLDSLVQGGTVGNQDLA
jgi:outer membrane protein TolC